MAREHDIPDSPPDTPDHPIHRWAEPCLVLFRCIEKGLELAEHRRFNQRIMVFHQAPPKEVRDVLKQHGFVYRPVENAWTIAATFANRVISDRLARQIAGVAQQAER